jgi:DNA modification methylase
MQPFQDRIKALRRVPAGSLRINPKNWRTHPPEQKAALNAVLCEIGFADAVLARECPDGGLELIDGHLRAELAPETEIPVLVLDVDQGEADKLLATLDPLAAMAAADSEKLDALLAGIETGSAELRAMLDEVAKEAHRNAPRPEIVEDELPDASQVPARCKLGDLWLLGRHRLLCGDSTKAEDVERLLAGRKPFIMVTDPPYGVEYDADWRDEFNTWGKAATASNVENDERVDWTEAYKRFPGHVAYVWHAGRSAADLVVNLRGAEFEIRTQIIWRKPTLIMSRGHYHWQHEPCWYAVRKGGSAKWCGDRTQSTVWDIQGMHAIGRKEDREPHPTQKPVECMARPIRNHGDKDDDVYDPFLGSGTTIIAAEQLNRRCYGLEISPAYCDVILARWEKLSGEKAVREDVRRPTETKRQDPRTAADAPRGRKARRRGRPVGAR